MLNMFHMSYSFIYDFCKRKEQLHLILMKEKRKTPNFNKYLCLGHSVVFLYLFNGTMKT